MEQEGSIKAAPNGKLLHAACTVTNVLISSAGCSVSHEFCTFAFACSTAVFLFAELAGRQHILEISRLPPDQKMPKSSIVTLF
jgi:hypothetical protein